MGREERRANNLEREETRNQWGCIASVSGIARKLPQGHGKGESGKSSRGVANSLSRRQP